MRAVRENEDLAESIGIHLARTKILAFTMSGAFAGAAGVHYAFLLQHISPSLFGAQDGIQLALIVLLGGAVPLLGPLVGSIVVLFVHELPFATNPNHVQIGYGLALVLLILLLPEGMVSGLKQLYARTLGACCKRSFRRALGLGRQAFHLSLQLKFRSVRRPIRSPMRHDYCHRADQTTPRQRRRNWEVRPRSGIHYDCHLSEAGRSGFTETGPATHRARLDRAIATHAKGTPC